MKIKWAEVALNDLDQIMVYIAKDSPETALQVLNRIENKAKLLEKHPLLGRQGRKQGTRELILAGLPYFIVYRIAPKWLVILRVLHQARRWPLH